MGERNQSEQSKLTSKPVRNTSRSRRGEAILRHDETPEHEVELCNALANFYDQDIDPARSAPYKASRSKPKAKKRGDISRPKE